MDTDRTVRVFTDFYRERGHHLITGSTLLPPPGDPVLFTTSGMHPLTPHLEGRPHPQGRRLVNVQRCLRTTDLDEVGDSTHLTVFEMLGSWSLGDYGHSQSLRWGYELLRDGFGIPHDRLHVTVFGGDEQVGPDLESAHLAGVGSARGTHPGGQLVVQRARRPVRPRLGDLRVDRRQPASGHPHHGPAVGGDLEPRRHAIPAPGGRLAPAP